MDNYTNNDQLNVGQAQAVRQGQGIFSKINLFKRSGNEDKVYHPFWVIVYKEISDHVRSWRFIILIAIIALTCLGSMYTALSNISHATKAGEPAETCCGIYPFCL